MKFYLQPLDSTIPYKQEIDSTDIHSARIKALKSFNCVMSQFWLDGKIEFDLIQRAEDLANATPIKSFSDIVGATHEALRYLGWKITSDEIPHYEEVDWTVVKLGSVKKREPISTRYVILDDYT